MALSWPILEPVTVPELRQWPDALLDTCCYTDHDLSGLAAFQIYSRPQILNALSFS